MEITAAVVCEPSGKFTIDNLEIDEPNDDEVLVLSKTWRRAGRLSRYYK